MPVYATSLAAGDFVGAASSQASFTEGTTGGLMVLATEEVWGPFDVNGAPEHTSPRLFSSEPYSGPNGKEAHLENPAFKN